MNEKTLYVICKGQVGNWWIDLIDPFDSNTWTPNCEVAYPKENTFESATQRCQELNSDYYA